MTFAVLRPANPAPTIPIVFITHQLPSFNETVRYQIWNIVSALGDIETEQGESSLGAAIGVHNRGQTPNKATHPLTTIGVRL